MLSARAILRAVLFCACMLGTAVPVSPMTMVAGAAEPASSSLSVDHHQSGAGARRGKPFHPARDHLPSSDPAAASVITAYMPIIRHQILMVLAPIRARRESTEAREALVEEIKDAANATVGTPARTDKQGRRKPAEGPVKHAVVLHHPVRRLRPYLPDSRPRYLGRLPGSATDRPCGGYS
jgi:hypothetical protein